MLEILPIENREKEAELLLPLNETPDTARILFMQDGGEDIGFVAVKLIGSTLVYLKFEIYGSENMMSFEKDIYMDILMRAGASYGENRGADALETLGNQYNDFLKKKGFKTDFSHAFAPMSLIVHYE